MTLLMKASTGRHRLTDDDHSDLTVPPTLLARADEVIEWRGPLLRRMSPDVVDSVAKVSKRRPTDFPQLGKTSVGRRSI